MQSAASCGNEKKRVCKAMIEHLRQSIKGKHDGNSLCKQTMLANLFLSPTTQEEAFTNIRET